MNDNVSDNDRDIVSKAMVSNNRFALNSFLYGESEIIIITDVMLKRYIKVSVHAKNHSELRFRFYNKASYEAFKRILASKYPSVGIAFINGAQILYAEYNNAFGMNNDILRLLLKIYKEKIADDDVSWKDFYESDYDDYLTLLSEYLNYSILFSENLNKRLEAASDSDKLLAMINMN